jgi:AbrB family looped-hinge helix DNA binding protein
MYTAKLFSGNRITVPKAVREAMGMVPGDKIEFVPDGSIGFDVIVHHPAMLKPAPPQKPTRAKPRNSSS